MPTCVAVGCTNRASKHIPGITFHKFPRARELRKAWFIAVRRKDWEPREHSVVCSDHFEESDFDRSSTLRVYLRPNAVPSIFKAYTNHKKKMNTEEDKKSHLFDVGTDVGEVAHIGEKTADISSHVSKDAIADASTPKSCPKCNLEFESALKLFRHRLHCKGCKPGISYCWSCKRKFRFRELYSQHHCTQLYSRKRRYRKLLRKNLAKAKGWVEKRKQDENKKTLLSDNDEDAKKDEDVGADSEVDSVSVIACEKCNEQFLSPKSLEDHHSKGLCHAWPLVCKICKKDFEFEGVEELNYHEVRCEDKLRVMTKLKEKREKHKIQQEQNKERVYTCQSCKNKYPAPRQLKQHLQKHPYCARAHNMKIKLRCMWERGDTLTKTARKSTHNYRGRSSNSYPIVRKLKPVKQFKWELESNTSVDSYEKPIMGAARKTFRKSSSQSEKKGSFCDVCYRYFLSYAELKVHKKTHYQEKKSDEMNKCPQCFSMFPDSYRLFAHQNEMDHWGKATKSITTMCTCPFCQKEFFLLSSRNAHLRSHVSQYPEEVKEFLQETTCHICLQIFTSETTKIQHFRIKHGDQPQPREKEPDFKKSSVNKGFQSHKYVGYPNRNVLVNVTPTISKLLKTNPNQCPICLKQYSTSFIRNRHFRTHTLDQAFECKFCPTKFPRSDRLTQHMQQEHNDFLAYECKECGLRFTTRMKALQHGSKAHSELPAKNIIKERNVFASSLQKKHSQYASALTAANSNETIIPDEEFYCEVCELSFLKLCGLQRHKQSKLHREILEKSQQSKLKVPEPSLDRPSLSLTPPFIDYSKKFSCNTCSLEFDSVNDFVPHRLSHFSSQNSEQVINELNPYSCEICGKIMDNHQKIQLHLFWHLQDVQLQAGPKKGEDDLTDSILPDLDKHPIAKKSFSKGSQQKQELVIAGVKKPLFTCDACKIGFVTLQHLSVHVRQYCRVRSKRQLQPEEDEDAEALSSVTAGFCKICGCIFSSSDLYEEHKTLFCNASSFAPLSENAEVLYTEMVKSLMKLDSMVAGCVRCNIAFDSMQNLSDHSSQHVEKSEVDINAVLNEPLEFNDIEMKEVNDTEFRFPADFEESQISVSDDNEISAMGDTSQIFEEDNQITDVENFSKLTEDSSDIPNDDLQNHILTEESDSLVIGNELESQIPLLNSNGLSNAEELNDECIEVDEIPHDTVESIDSLRNNFSRLLCVLVSDQELMEQLGYGKRLIDEVLVNVLDQMGLVPFPADEVLTKIERLRKNIRILLDVCIKDQIMELITDAQTTTDSIVESALKMFNSDDPHQNSTAK